MAAAFQQQIFALDARFNAYRAPNFPNFKTLYIRRRSQLLRENAKFKDIETIKNYINIRSQLLQKKYGVQDNISLSSSSSRRQSMCKINTNINDSQTNKKKRNELSVSENYAFSGVHHIFDQHKEQVSVVKFANNSRSLVCCASHDGRVSVCEVGVEPRVLCLLDAHTQPATDCDWSASNELVVSCGLDGVLCVWQVAAARRLRATADPLRAPLLCCTFHPANNNMLIAGNAKGMVQVLNISTGIYPPGGSSYIGGRVQAIACESSGTIFWTANDKGLIVSYSMDGRGRLGKLRRCGAGGAAVTSLAWSPWLARRPALLAVVAPDHLLLYRVTDRSGGLSLRQRFPCAASGACRVRATFCPLVTLRRGACVVAGGDDACVRFVDTDAPPHAATLNKLQGHSAPVLGVSFSYDESLLASSDAAGLVIIWRRE